MRQQIVPTSHPPQKLHSIYRFLHNATAREIYNKGCTTTWSQNWV